ncbi:MAG: S-adenosylmethionine:tRNA ribosyltransferase-isomerase, partial [bacterium]
AQSIETAKKEGRRIIAVGTTVTRALEGVAALGTVPGLSQKCPFGDSSLRRYPRLIAYQGDINLFIKPGFEFKIIDGLITNFHLPESTLLVLVSAFAGRENILRAYEAAIKEKYRFFSFGDAMLIV